jgi:hypothetical protein
MRVAVLLLAFVAVPAVPGRAQNEWDVRANLLDRLSVVPNSPALVKSLGDAA